ncbi:hypothetical protein Cantr_07054 [Candida viswanathii]|uniref:Uncharacterized protein n=1 Tax=Candida viswanathii TaxID=5486 RepID=A0A367Y0H7_9ASCO|nr:hypothetical protein Cantr_07054 [Candida viswanathii]
MKLGSTFILAALILAAKPVISSPDSTSTAIASLNSTLNQTSPESLSTTTNLGNALLYPVFLVLISVAFSLL